MAIGDWFARKRASESTTTAVVPRTLENFHNDTLDSMLPPNRLVQRQSEFSLVIGAHNNVLHQLPAHSSIGRMDPHFRGTPAGQGSDEHAGHLGSSERR